MSQSKAFGNVIKLDSIVNVKDPRFGAKGDGVTDDQPAFQAAVTWMAANLIETLFVPDGVYYFASHVVISANQQNVRLTGTAMAGWLTDDTHNCSEITGANGLAELFLVTANNSAIEVDHIRWRGKSVTTGVVSAIRSTAQGSPARPFNIHNCHFTGFAKAIYSNLNPAGGATGMCQVNIRENFFTGNGYALYGDGKLGAIMDLAFIGNICEQNVSGAIKTLNSGAAATWNISDNLMEGQPNSIQISAGLCQCTIERNYFEANTGDIVNFAATNSGSSLKMGQNYYTNVANTRVTVDSASFFCQDDLPGNSILLNLSGVVNKAQPRTGKFTCLATPATVINNLDAAVVRDQQGLPAALGGDNVSVGTTLTGTPMGLRGTEQFVTNSSLFVATGDLAIGDFVIVTALVRSVDAGTLSVLLYDNASAPITQTSPVSIYNRIGEYALIHAAIKATAISTGTYKIRFQADAGKIAVVADFYSYRLLAPTGASAYYAYLPMLAASGQATMANGQVAAVVTHGMGITPRNVQVIPSYNLGYVWVDTITATQFTINCSIAPGADKTVYWTAN